MRQIFCGVARKFPEVRSECAYIDAAAFCLVQRPESFDVLVTENTFGDILPDLAARLVGEMAMFQPSHGTAPDIAGKGIANPVANILSVAMMLDWLGLDEGSKAIHFPVRTAFSERKLRTPDMGGALITGNMTESIITAVP
jgi:3-isopropylmalate dehydrogenase